MHENYSNSESERSVRVSELEIESSKVREESKDISKSSNINVQNIPFIPNRHDISDSFIDQIKELDTPLDNNSLFISPNPNRNAIYIESPEQGTITSEEALVEESRDTISEEEVETFEISHPVQISIIPTIPDEPLVTEFSEESEAIVSFRSEIEIKSKRSSEGLEGILDKIDFINPPPGSSVENSEIKDSVSSRYRDDKSDGSYFESQSYESPDKRELSYEDNSPNQISQEIIQVSYESPSPYKHRDLDEIETRIKKSPEPFKFNKSREEKLMSKDQSSISQANQSDLNLDSSHTIVEPEDIIEITENILNWMLIEELALAVKPEVPILNIIKIKSQSSEPAVETDDKSIDKYLDKLANIILDHPEDIEYALSAPIPNSPLEMLSKMQENEIGTAVIPDIPPSILPIDLYLEMEKQITDRALDQSSQEAQHIHNKMIFDSVNESLQKFRVYGEAGEPMPWSFDVRAIHLKYPDLKEICLRVKDEVLLWNSMQAGKVPILESNKSSANIDEEVLQNIREDKLASMLALEVVEHDHQWVNYEFEENQVKLDIADMVLEHLVAEVITILE